MELLTTKVMHDGTARQKENVIMSLLVSLFIIFHQYSVYLENENLGHKEIRQIKLSVV